MYGASRFVVRRVGVMGEQFQRISMRAHAKLNLALCVGSPIDAPGSPTHGYHPICSYMHAIELHDVIEIENNEHTSYDIRWVESSGREREVEWDIEGDLVVRIHRILSEYVGQTLDCSIRVRKSIPAGGGLGGGSSDAASVLLGLNHVFDLGLERAALVRIAMSLGSDIAYFTDPGYTPPRPAIVSGFGETIERVETSHSGQVITLIFPPFGCATGAVYRAFDSISGHGEPKEPVVRACLGASQLRADLIVNDLYTPACEVQSRLRPLRERIMHAVGSGVHLSGSGSTLYVLGRVEESLIHEVASDCRVVHTRLC